MVFVTPRLDLRAAMQWWHSYLLEAPARQAERIRNGLLQEIHVLQRQLELRDLEPSLTDAEQLYRLEPRLEPKLQSLYRELDSVSDQLAIPQLTDLALAIHQRLTVWQAKYPHILVQFDNSEIAAEQGALNQLLLLTVDALLQLIGSHSHGPLRLQLRPSETMGQLFVTVQLDAAYGELPISVRQRLTYLETSFAFLSGGDCQQQEETPSHVREISYLFRWPTNLDNFINSGGSLI